MMRNSQPYITSCAILSLVLLVLACGKDGSSNSSSSSARQNEEAQEGLIYKSQLLPINSVVGGSSIGLLQWKVVGSSMTLHLSMTNTPEDLEHFQAIHAGSSCPTDNADTNSDGIIDMAELERVSGNVLFPLDSDLSSLEKGDFSLSRANAYGNYVYSGQISTNQMRSIASSLSPDNKVVVVYGINQNFNLPATTHEVNGNKHRYIPVACGVIKAAPEQNLY